MPMASRRPLPANHRTNVVSLTERRHPGLSIGRFSIPMVPTLRTAPTRVTRRAVKLRAVLNWCGEGISNMLPLTWTTPRCRIGGPPEISPLPCGSSVCGHGPDCDVDWPVFRMVVRRLWGGRCRDFKRLEHRDHTGIRVLHDGRDFGARSSSASIRFGSKNCGCLNRTPST